MVRELEFIISVLSSRKIKRLQVYLITNKLINYACVMQFPQIPKKKVMLWLTSRTHAKVYPWA